MRKLTRSLWLLLVVFQSVAVQSAEIEFKGQMAIGHSKELPLLGISSIRYDEGRKQFILLTGISHFSIFRNGL